MSDLYPPAHHLKLEGPSEHDVRMQLLFDQWRARVAAGFKASDYLSRAERSETSWRLSLRRNAAQAWIRDQPRRMRERLRRSLRVVVGGRS